MHRIPFVALGAAVGLAMGALTATTTSAQVAPAADAPTVGDCVKDSAMSAWDPFEPAEMVDCADAHTGEVTYLGTYPEDLPAPSEVGDSIYEYWDQMCPFPQAQKYYRSVRPKIATRVVSTFKVPTDAEWKSGDRTVLCMAVAPTLKGELQSWKGTLPNLLSGFGFTTFLACQKPKPKTTVWVDRGPCTNAKQWLLVAGVPIKAKASKPFPGSAVQKAADKACKKKAKSYTTKGKKVTFVASVAPEELWNDGVTFADCLIPYSHYNGKR